MHLPYSPRRPAHWFGAVGVLVFLAEAVGYAACRLLGTAPPHPTAWAAFAVVALVSAGGATALMAPVTDDGADAVTRGFELALANKAEQQRKLRHDIRGALSPVLLVADRLLNHADPAVKRSGEIMVKTVDRAIALLAESGEAEANPPSDS